MARNSEHGVRAMALGGELTSEEKAFQVTEHGLRVAGQPSLEVCLRFSRRLSTTDRCIQFVVGDFLAWVQDRYGEESSQIVDATEWKESTVRVYEWVARSVGQGVRRLDKLTFQHHKLVARLPPLKQKEWLDLAADSEDEPWTVARLQEALAEGEDLPINAWYVVVKCKDRKQQQEVARDLNGRGIEAEEKYGRKRKKKADADAA